ELRRKEKNKIWNIDPYLQASWDFAERWTLDAGVRYSTVRFDSDDRYMTAGNGDDSGSARYNKVLPMAALRYQATEDLNLYAPVGMLLETPTYIDLPSRDDGLAGLNFALPLSVDTSVEVGANARVGSGVLTPALFQPRTDEEIVAGDAAGGRTTSRSAGRTRR